MRKRINLKLIITLLSILLVLATAVLIVYMKTDFFRTKRSAFFRYFNSTSDVLKILETDEFKEYKNRKETIPYTRKAEITIQNSSNIADSNILDKLKLVINEKADNKNEKNNIKIGLKKESDQVINFEAIKNKNVVGVFCNDIFNSYIGVRNIELKRIAADMGIGDATLIPNEYNNINIEKVIETSKLEKKHITECVKIIRNSVPNNSYNKLGKKKIKINDNSYSTTAYSLELNSNEASELIVNILNKISKDSILMDFAASKFKLLNFNSEYTTINSLNDEIKKKASEIQSNPQKIGNLVITVYEYKQKNVRTEIKFGDNTIQIDHLKEDAMETSSVKVNNKVYKLQYNGINYSISYDDNSENGRKIKIDYNQNGTIENNDIRNNMVITVNQGIKSITYSYKDNVEFTNSVDYIDDFSNKSIAILNDYSDEEIKEFTKSLKEKINDVYVNKGADVGINLDPLFVLEE